MKNQELFKKIFLFLDAHKIHSEIFCEEWEESSINLQNGVKDFQHFNQSFGIGIRMLREGRVSFFNSTSKDFKSIRKGLEIAVDLIRIVPETPMKSFAAPVETPRIEDLNDPRFSSAITATDNDELKDLHTFVRSRLSRTLKDDAGLSKRRGVVMMCNSEGINEEYTKTNYHRWLQLVIGDDSEKLDWEEDESACCQSRLPTFRTLAERVFPLIEGTFRGAPLPTGPRAVIFHPGAGQAYWESFLRCLSGELVNAKSSYLAGRLNEQITVEAITLWNDPTKPGSPHARPFDGEGIASRKKMLVEKGRLVNFFDTLTTAAQSGRSAGDAQRGYGNQPEPGWNEIFMKFGDASPEKIIQESEGAFYVTRLLGFGLDSVSGSYSIGASGRLIEAGKLGRAVANITIAGMLDELMHRIDRIGNDDLENRSIHSPTFRISEMMIGGK